MGKPKYDPPTNTFPYKIPKRLNILSVPRAYILDTGEDMPVLSPYEVRQSALRAPPSDRVNDAAWPYIRRLLALKRMYKNRFTPERLERLERMIEASNATMYSKLANCTIDFKKQDAKDVKKKRGWSESEWKKHMDYIRQIAHPKKVFPPQPINRGAIKPLEALLPRLNIISNRPYFKIYKPLAEEEWYRDPEKVSPNALKYVITDRTKQLAVARVIPTED